MGGCGRDTRATGFGIFDPRSTIHNSGPCHAGRLPPVVAQGGVGDCHWGRGDGSGRDFSQPLGARMGGILGKGEEESAETLRGWIGFGLWTEV